MSAKAPQKCFFSPLNCWYFVRFLYSIIRGFANLNNGEGLFDINFFFKLLSLSTIFLLSHILDTPLILTKAYSS